MPDVTTVDTPVLIVGAGPIGLSVAMELAWRGIECTIVDEGDGSVDLSRGGMVAIRTMEYWRRWGIAHLVEHAGFPQDYPLNMVYCTSLDGYLLEHHAYPAQQDVKPPESSPERRTWCPQLIFDPLLARELAKRPECTMRYHCRVESFEQDEAGVTAHCADPRSGERMDIRAQYMVGCDGAASFVRDTLGIPFEGEFLGYAINIYFNAPTFNDNPLGPGERYIFVGPEGTWSNATVVNGRDDWRLSCIAGKEKVDLEAFDPPGKVRRAVGANIPFTVTAVRPWRRSEMLAKRFRDGRILLAGDAAHTMSPTGGFGANTGVIDAINLGWKLQAALEGWAGDGLLDTYQAEQEQVVRRNAKASTFNYEVLTGLRGKCGPILDDTPEGARVRDFVGTALKEGLREEWECTGVMLGYRYDDSPICVPDGTEPPPDPIDIYYPVARPGSRAPHAWLADGRSTLDLFGRGFVLLRLGDDPVDAERLTQAAARHKLPLEVIDVADPEIAALYERKLVLVRPDGHVAWRDDALPGDADALVDIVRGAAKTNSLANAANAA